MEKDFGTALCYKFAAKIHNPAGMIRPISLHTYIYMYGTARSLNALKYAVGIDNYLSGKYMARWECKRVGRDARVLLVMNEDEWKPRRENVP